MLISGYYQCWKQLCCFIFFWKRGKFKRTAFIWNRKLVWDYECHFWSI